LGVGCVLGFPAVDIRSSENQISTGYWRSGSGGQGAVSIIGPSRTRECRVAGGKAATEGANEELPVVLENMLPGYSAWPSGYTVGPNENLKTFSSEQKIKYLLEKLPQFRKLGWMTDDAFIRYERFLKGNRFDVILGQIDQDLKAEQITTEVFAIVQSMR
jgi:hypothetical protein